MVQAEEIAKIRKDLIEVEDLVYQMMFFAHQANDAEYTKVIVTNLSKKILEFLSIEHSDIEHLFQHEHSGHNYSAHTAKDKSDTLHSTLEKENDQLKTLVGEIPLSCSALAKGKMTREDFIIVIEDKCGQILRLVGSENHELDFAKQFITALGKQKS